jgi:tetratricopeptide (TPR) repeat protein
MKKYSESLEVFQEAFQLREREAHVARKSENAQEAQLKMAKIRHNIGCVNFELGNLEDAKVSYVEAIDQQKRAFGTWSTPFMIMTDTTKPGFLTMASTMCNKGEQYDVHRWRKELWNHVSSFIMLPFFLSYYPQDTLTWNRRALQRPFQFSTSLSR